MTTVKTHLQSPVTQSDLLRAQRSADVSLIKLTYLFTFHRRLDFPMEVGSRGATLLQKVVVTGVGDIWRARGARAYNGGLCPFLHVCCFNVCLLICEIVKIKKKQEAPLTLRGQRGRCRNIKGEP